MQTTSQQAMPQSGEGFQERTLIISHLSADFKKDHDLIGNQDPYLVLELSKDTVTTRVMKSAGTHAEWPAEEGYRLHDRGEHPDLIARAYNKNSLLKDTLLGEGRIPMMQLGGGQEHMVSLFDKKGQQAGELRFRAQEEQGGSFGSQTGSQTGQQGMGTTAGAAGAAAAGVMAHNARHKEDTARREMETAGRQRMDRNPQTYDNTRVGQGMVDTSRDGNTGMMRQGETNMQGAPNTQGATNVQSGNEQTGMLRDAAVVGAAGAGAGAGAGYMSNRNQGQMGETNNPMANQGANHEFTSTQVLGGPKQDTTSSYDRTGQTGQGETMVDKLKGAVGMGPTSTTGQDTSSYDRTGQTGQGETMVDKLKGAVGMGPTSTTGQDTSAYDRTGQTGQGETMVDKLKGAVGMGPTSQTEQDTSAYDRTGQTGQGETMVDKLKGAVGMGTTSSTGQGVQTNTSSETTDRDVDTTQEKTSSTGGGMQVDQNRNVTNTVDETTKESSEHVKRGRGEAVLLESGDDHWQRSLEAAGKAREQALIVERESQATHAKLLAAQEATRSFEKARREHMAIQERLAALDLESKRAAFDHMTKEYEAAMARVSGKEGQVDAAQQAANELRAEVNQRGQVLNEEVNATKLHQSRLAEIEAELARLEGLHGAADSAHKDHLSRLEPLRSRHRSLQETFAGVEAELTESQRRRVALEAKERELQNLLESHCREFDATATDYAEMEEIGRKKAADAEARAAELRELEAEATEVQRNLAEHRNRIGVLKQETEAQLASAGELADNAARKEAELDAAQQAIAEKEQLAGTAASALSEVEAQKGPLEEKVRNERSTFDHHKEVVDEMHRKLGMAREQVDLAQARKEELWEKAKWHGEQADKASDSHFLHAHRDHSLVTGGSTVPATDMLKHGNTTKTLLEKTGEKIGL